MQNFPEMSSNFRQEIFLEISQLTTLALLDGWHLMRPILQPASRDTVQPQQV